jgi:predicted unusual protein kinase regulating ubiquinone biosynthesis (AarF/ABC1/UbiB family)
MKPSEAKVEPVEPAEVIALRTEAEAAELARKADKKRRRREKKKDRFQRAIDSALAVHAARVVPKAEPSKVEGPATTDERLAALDEIMATPLGAAWIETTDPKVKAFAPKPGVIEALPRRQIARVKDRDTHHVPAMTRTVTFEAATLLTIGRLFLWVFAAFKFFGGNLKDALIGKNTLERRAVRLREVLESLGATFIKLGQQLSIRADILPYAYCEELAKMLDRVPAFPTEKAIEAIERVNGKKVTEIFSVFDPTPIGSASLACVYQAMLPNGEKVAVKVRRPNVGKLLAADLRALGWLMEMAEVLSFIRPGMTRNLRVELHSMLFEELNYFMEARYTELFARRARKKKQTYLEAPKVYFELSGEDVLVTEFVSGMFLWEILGALDRDDQPAIAAIKATGVDPILLSKRMIRAFNWETLECLFFHADPHPANLVIRPDNTLVFIDFGSCGRFSSKMKRLWQQLQYYIDLEDVQGMVETSIAILEPLPPIDIDRLTKEMEALYWDWLYATKSKHAEWWERCTGNMWMRFIGLARRHNVPMNLDTLRLFRATFLYDSIAMRLWNGLNMSREYMQYSRERGRRARKRVRRLIKRRIEEGPTNRDYLRIEDTWRFWQQLYNRIQHSLDNPDHRFSNMLGKAAFGVSMTLRFLTLGVGLHILAVLGAALILGLLNQPRDLGDIFSKMIMSEAYQVAVGLTVLIVIRRSLMRLEDIDVEKK